MGEPEKLVPDDVIPHRSLPPLRYRDMPQPISWRHMVGPSIILAGLSLGSGEFIIWPYIVYKTQFVFFWACLLGVVTQFFLNMEIERWTLVTGESAITGFCRLSRQWAWVFLLMNIIPHVWPGWATGAGQMISWTLFGAEQVPLTAPLDAEPDKLPAGLTYDQETKQLLWTEGGISEETRARLLAASQNAAYQTAVNNLADQAQKGLTFTAPYVNYFGIGGLFLVGIVLTAGPVVYNTVEKVQLFLVGLIFLLVIILSFLVIHPAAVEKMVAGSVNFGQMPELSADITLMTLLGALAFAGAGGTTNLGQSNFIKDKGYGMGAYIGRITSPITGQEEATVDIGYHFEHSEENLSRWRQWWRAANIEHFFSFFLTCVACLVLLSLISYSLFYDLDGNLKPGMGQFGKGMNFVWGQATVLEGEFGGGMKVAFMVMGIAILLTTEFGILDTVARISTDVVKVNYLSNSAYWSQSKLYYLFLWGEILVGSGILLAGEWVPNFQQPLFLLVTAAALNGGVMFLYSMLLLYLNSKILSRSLSVSPLRFVAMVWSCAFFGYFTIQALQHKVLPELFKLLDGG